MNESNRSADGFTEWRRSQIRGGVERRERNDFFETYNVYGVDQARQLTCRCFHRYPEHERAFGMTYSRTLSFDEFNRRLLGELDKKSMTLAEYHDCIRQAEEVSGIISDSIAYDIFSDNEYAVMQAFCDSMDTLKEKTYLHGGGLFSCDCESVVGGEPLSIRFRRPLPHDALSMEIAGVRKETIGGYDIDNLWVMSVYNRLNERCSSCRLTQLTSEWSLNHETIRLVAAEGFPGIDGELLIAVAEPTAFRRFGFYSLDFSNK